MKQLFGIAVILATLLALSHTKAHYDASYVKTGDCKVYLIDINRFYNSKGKENLCIQLYCCSVSE